MSSTLGELASTTMTKYDLLITIILGLLVCGVYADFPCKTEQIHWIGKPGKRYKCLECPDCPAGSEPSVPCGTSVAYGTPVHCIPCQLGKTYSDKYGKTTCEACTECSQGKTLKKNCTLSSNSECDAKCAHGFYPLPFIFSCMACTECCNDSKDVFAKECANYGKKCKVRTTPCKVVHTLPSTTVTTVDHTTSTVGETTRSTRPVIDQNTTRSPDIQGQRGEDSENKTLEILAIVGAALVIVGLTVCIVRQFKPCNMRSQNNRDVSGLSPSNRSSCVTASEVQVNLDGMTLSQLEENHQEIFDWVCLKLDNRRWSFRRDYERLAAKYKEISLEERNALQDELQSKGSPSKMLMSHIQTKYPSLSLEHFIGTLKDIGRNDIAHRLTTRPLRNP